MKVRIKKSGSDHIAEFVTSLFITAWRSLWLWLAWHYVMEPVFGVPHVGYWGLLLLLMGLSAVFGRFPWTHHIDGKDWDIEVKP